MKNDVAQIQKTNPRFSYDSYSYIIREGELVFSFTFSSGEHTFHPTLAIQGVTKEMVENVAENRMNAWAFQLGLAEIPTYWKAFCSPMIEIACGTLSEEQIKFWQKLIYKGMGEFFFQNKIEPFNPEFRIKNQESRGQGILEKLHATHPFGGQISYKPQAILVPVGGGKDSIVSLELLAEAGYHITTWSGHVGASGDVIDVFQKRHGELHARDIIFSRTIDPHLLELNKLGYLNGHTPFSSVLAFFTSCTAELFRIPYIAVSNEGSANEPTAIWNGIDVNHQYSKSFEFEHDFQEYITNVLPGSPSYFSFVRPWYEIQIVKKFIKYSEYFPVFRSCNVGQKTHSWCGKCPKCAFVALMLAAFVDDEVITNIFGYPILGNIELIPLVDQLVGLSEYKPFECVGTRQESKLALVLALEKRPKAEALLEHYRDQHFTVDSTILDTFSAEHALPKEFERVLAEH